MPFKPLPFLLALCFALPAAAHEFWIEPDAFQVPTSSPIEANLKNGQGFSGINLAYFETRTDRFQIVSGGETRDYAGRMGDVPAFRLDQAPDGLLVVIHQTTPSTLTYSKWTKFRAFVTRKDAAWALERHAERGLPQSGFQELYTRFAKSLIGVGNASGMDRDTGLEIELTALANPYTDDLSAGLPVRLSYRGAPRAAAQIEVFERAPGGLVTITRHRTDTEGRALIPVRPGHVYQLDSVVLREPPPGSDAAWESLWANLTFAVP